MCLALFPYLIRRVRGSAIGLFRTVANTVPMGSLYMSSVYCIRTVFRWHEMYFTVCEFYIIMTPQVTSCVKVMGNMILLDAGVCCQPNNIISMRVPMSKF